jgi:hypothetical protein
MAVKSSEMVAAMNKVRNEKIIGLLDVIITHLAEN